MDPSELPWLIKALQECHRRNQKLAKEKQQA